MSNLKMTERQPPLSRVVSEAAGVYSLSAVRGAMAVIEAAEADLGTDAFALLTDTTAAKAHFSVSRSGLLPVRHLHVCAVPTGTDAVNVDVTLWFEFYDPDMALWSTSGEMHVRGATARATALAADEAGLSNIFWVDVPSGATHGRVVLLALAANQGVKLTVQGDNDD